MRTGLVATMLWRRKPGSRQAGEGSHRPTLLNAIQTIMHCGSCTIGTVAMWQYNAM